jgi:hypothetical protein
VLDDLDLFHYAAADLAGTAGFEPLNAHIGASWRATSRLRVELALAHMSTHALEIYARDLLETADPEAEPGAPAQNNLSVIRMASDEGRVGLNASLPARLSVHGELRVRARETLADTQLPMEIASIGADRQLELSAGLRQRRSILSVDLGGDVVVVRGDRTQSRFVTGRLQRDVAGGRMGGEVELSRIDYDDRCPGSSRDPTCTGSTSGATLRGGGTVRFAPERRWLVLVDYRAARNRSAREGTALPSIVSHSVFFRIQYAF